MKKTWLFIIIAYLISFNLVLAVPSVQNGYQVELWYSSSDAFQGIRVGKGAFGSMPYVANYTSSTIIRITGKGTTETFVTGLNSAGYAKIVFDDNGAYGNDMYVASPFSGVTQDPIYRVKPNGTASLFHLTPSPSALTNGIAFGKGGAFQNKLYVQDYRRKNLKSFSPNASASGFGGGLYGDDVQDDLIITGGGAFGVNAYMTAASYGQIVRMSESGVVNVFATGQNAFALAMGSGRFGEYLFLGTTAGSIYKYDSTGAATLFASGFGQVIRGLDISGDSMWITASDTLSNGNIYQITIPEPCTLSLLAIGGLLLRKRK